MLEIFKDNLICIFKNMTLNKKLDDTLIDCNEIINEIRLVLKELKKSDYNNLQYLENLIEKLKHRIKDE